MRGAQQLSESSAGRARPYNAMLRSGQRLRPIAAGLAGGAALGAALPQLSQLAVLDLGIGIMEDGETAIDCAGLTALVQHLPEARALRVLNICNCHGSFRHVGVQALIDVLPRCPSLRVIGADEIEHQISSALVHRLEATPETSEHLNLIEEFNCQDPRAW